METILILSALGVLLFTGLVVVSMLTQAKRPELRMAREVDLFDEAGEGEEALMRSLEPARPSPIDRTATILEIEPPAEPRLPGSTPEDRAPDGPRDREARR